MSEYLGTDILEVGYDTVQMCCSAYVNHPAKSTQYFIVYVNMQTTDTTDDLRDKIHRCAVAHDILMAYAVANSAQLSHVVLQPDNKNYTANFISSTNKRFSFGISVPQIKNVMVASSDLSTRFLDKLTAVLASVTAYSVPDDTKKTTVSALAALL